MALLGQTRQDVVSALPNRLETIHRNIKDDYFNSMSFAGWVGIESRDAINILRRMHSQGWLNFDKPMTRESGCNIYYLSRKAINYLEKYNNFTNQKAPLMMRWQPRTLEVEIETPGETVAVMPRHEFIILQEGKKFFITVVAIKTQRPIRKIGPFSSEAACDEFLKMD